MVEAGWTGHTGLFIDKQRRAMPEKCWTFHLSFGPFNFEVSNDSMGNKDIGPTVALRPCTPSPPVPTSSTTCWTYCEGSGNADPSGSTPSRLWLRGHGREAGDHATGRAAADNINRRIRIFDCAAHTRPEVVCRSMRFQVALDRPEPPSAIAPRTTERSQVTIEKTQGAVEDDVTVRGRRRTGRGGSWKSRRTRRPTERRSAPAKDDISPDDEPGTLALRLRSTKYPSSEVAEHAHDIMPAQHPAVQGPAPQRRSSATSVSSRSGPWTRTRSKPPRSGRGSQRRGRALELEIYEKKTSWPTWTWSCSTGAVDEGADRDVYHLEVCRGSPTKPEATSASGA